MIPSALANACPDRIDRLQRAAVGIELQAFTIRV